MVKLQWLAAGAAAVCLAACGTTVPLSQQQTTSGGFGSTEPGGSSGPGNGLSGTGASARPGSSAPGHSGGLFAAPTGRPGVAPATGSPASSLSSAQPVAPASPGTLGHGITKSAIQLGVVVLKNGDKFAHGMGFSISFGDAETEFNAVIDDINQRGGIFGRQLVPMVAYYDLGAAALDPEGQQAAMCATFTQDHHVFAVLMPYNPLPSFLDCLAKSHTLVLNGSAESNDDQGERHLLGSYVAPSLVSYSRYPRTLVSELAQHGFFGTSPTRKAGIVVMDTPYMVRAAEQALKPAIEAAGTQVAMVERVSPTNSSTSDINNAVLKFKATGITHVFFMQAAGGIPLYFMEEAENQQYRPSYGLSSFEVPGFFLQGQAPNAQLTKAVGIGWEPFFDLKAGEYPNRPQEKRCFDVIARKGETNTNRQSNLTATPVCDLVWVFEAAARHAGTTLNNNTWLAGLRQVGSSYASPVALHADFGTGRQDAATGYRWTSFVTSCNCFRYSGPQKNGWL